ncbi:ESCRT II complex subunit Dot2 [Ophidiomyces ophidiicola]|uniref:ESCRT II complex subunit Dot2 n=1 Tax=Ophidiomyces ophidiicola TaxID=1387563 RepID=UPI0020C4F65F|nr:ESCRT II complex subunit Dot2 [Ophidiomyces ophidiicola]KAI1938250.1 ESCRT II complex subunit Dot2 [Ophidiomyces ophidiicola]KAI2057058.1 ESCRT II complex subunit Dot2 [Ophidiomyces ophidiicola]KAI2085291.1 ESCRT II complex subunit Dot2 [Ophidiomyces ophidiicola]
MSTRRGVGLGAFANRSQTTQSYANHGASLRSTHLTSLQTQLSVFQSLLHTFALEHGETIKSNPTFRAEFARMCHAIGVDPLAASNVKGKGKRGFVSGLAEGGSFWTQVLGGDVNDFYFEVAVRVVELCRETRAENGGLISVEECRTRVARGKAIGGGLEVSEDDVLRAVKSLEPLGSGFSIIKVGSKQFVRSVPKELNTDQATVLEVIQLLGFVTVSMLQLNLKWEKARTQTVLDDLLADGLVWLDTQCEEHEYWSPQNSLDENV